MKRLILALTLCITMIVVAPHAIAYCMKDFLKIVTFGEYTPTMDPAHLSQLPEQVRDVFTIKHNTGVKQKISRARADLRDWLMWMNKHRDPVVATKASLDGLALARWSRDLLAKDVADGLDINALAMEYNTLLTHAENYPKKKVEMEAEARSYKSYIEALQRAKKTADATKGIVQGKTLNIPIEWAEYSVAIHTNKDGSTKFVLVKSKGKDQVDNLLNLKQDLHEALVKSYDMPKKAKKISDEQADNLKKLETVLRRFYDAKYEWETLQGRHEAKAKVEKSNGITKAGLASDVPAGKEALPEPPTPGFTTKPEYEQFIKRIEALYDRPFEDVVTNKNPKPPQFKTEYMPASWDRQKNIQLWEEFIDFFSQRRDRVNIGKEKIKAYMELAKSATPEELQRIGGEHLTKLVSWYSPWSWTRLGKIVGLTGLTSPALIRQLLILMLYDDPDNEVLDWKKECASKFGTKEFNSCVLAQLKKMFPKEFQTSEKDITILFNKEGRFKNKKMQDEFEAVVDFAKNQQEQKHNDEVAAEILDQYVEQLGPNDDMLRTELIKATESDFNAAIAPLIETRFRKNQLDLLLLPKTRKQLEEILSKNATSLGFPKNIGNLIELAVLEKNTETRDQLFEALKSAVVPINADNVDFIQGIVDERNGITKPKDDEKDPKDDSKDNPEPDPLDDP